MKKITALILSILMLMSISLSASADNTADGIDYSAMPKYAFSDIDSIYSTEGYHIYNCIGMRASKMSDLAVLFLAGGFEGDLWNMDAWGRYFEDGDGSVRMEPYDWSADFDPDPEGLVGLSVWDCGVKSSPTLYDEKTDKMVDNPASYSFENVSLELYLGRYVCNQNYNRAFTQTVIHLPGEDGVYEEAVKWLSSEFGGDPVNTEKSDHGTTVRGEHYAEVTGYEYASKHEELTCSRLSQWIVQELNNPLGAVLIDCSEILDDTGAVAECTVRLTWMEK